MTLEETADWQYQKEVAKNSVLPLVGVNGVVNEITIKPRVSASDVKTKIEDALKRDAAIDAEHIRVETSGGAVTLRGACDPGPKKRKHCGRPGEFPG